MDDGIEIGALALNVSIPRFGGRTSAEASGSSCSR